MRTFALQAVYNLNVSAAALRAPRGPKCPERSEGSGQHAGGEAIGGAERTGGAERSNRVRGPTRSARSLGKSGGAGSRTCPANDRKTKRRADLHGHYGDLEFSRWGGRGQLRIT